MSIVVPVYKKYYKTDRSNYGGLSLLSTDYIFYPTSCCQNLLHMQRKLLGFINVDFYAAGQLLIIYGAFVKYLRKARMQ